MEHQADPGEEGYTTAPEDYEPGVPHAAPSEPAVTRGPRGRSHSCVGSGSREHIGLPREALKRSCHSISGFERPPSPRAHNAPTLFSEISFVGPSDESQLFRSPKKRISAWLTERKEELSPEDVQRDRELMFLLLENRSFGYPGTDGTLLSNYVAYCLNRHPLLSIVTAHPLHPFTRAERLVVLTCSFCWAFLVKAMMHREPLISQPWYFFYTILALLVLPYEYLIRAFAVCSCFQYDHSEVGHRRRRAWLCCGRFVLALLTLFNIAFLSYGVWVTVSVQRVRPYSLLRQSWSTIVLKSWTLLVWFPTWLPVFLAFYNHHKQAWLEAHPPSHPCHVAATSTEDGGASVLYWLLVAWQLGPPRAPRVSRRFSRSAISSLPLIDPTALRLRLPRVRRAKTDEPRRSAAASQGAADDAAGGSAAASGTRVLPRSASSGRTPAGWAWPLGLGGRGGSERLESESGLGGDSRTRGVGGKLAAARMPGSLALAFPRPPDTTCGAAGDVPASNAASCDRSRGVTRTDAALAPKPMRQGTTGTVEMV